MRFVAAVIADLFLRSYKINFPFQAASTRELAADVCLAFGPQNFWHRRPHRDRGRCTSGASPRLSRRLLFRHRLSVRTPGEKSFDCRGSKRPVKLSADYLCIPFGSTVAFYFSLLKKNTRIILMSLL